MNIIPIVRENDMTKGETLLKSLRKKYGAKPFTKYDARRIYPASGSYINEVFKRAKKLGILKPAVKCKTAYRIDPDPSGRLWCSLDNKPYDESVCPTIAELIEVLREEGA